MKGERVELRQVLLSDLPLIADWRNGDVASSRQSGLTTSADMLAWFDRVNAPGRTEHAFTVTVGQRAIGYVRLGHVDIANSSAEVSYIISPEFRKQGYGSEAVQRAVEWGFHVLALERIEAEVYEFNKVSQKLLEDLGFTLEGSRRSAVRRAVSAASRPRRFDSLIYGLLADEFYRGGAVHAAE